MLKRAVFLDRDGVLNETIFRMGKPRAPYSLDELKLCEGVPEAVRLLKDAGLILVIVTNQPDVARGWIDRGTVEALNQKIFADLGVHDLKVCYHTEKDGCDCRKPRPGMLMEAAGEWKIDVKNSFMVGDRHSDIEAGEAAGCFTILIGPGDKADGIPKPDFTAKSLLEGAHWILSQMSV